VGPGRLVQDRRIGGRTDLWTVLPEGVDALMLVPSEIRECIFFVCAHSSDGTLTPMGTGFICSRPAEGGRVMMLVTAKHVLIKAEQASDDGAIYLRFNARSGNFAALKMSRDTWLLHPTDETAIDVAVHPWTTQIAAAVAFKAWPIEMSADEEFIQREGVGLGDEVLMVGLFVNHAGNRKNVPIVRQGLIAAMPEEPIYTENFGPIDAYLIEVRSIGGFSGSPVFLHMGGLRGSTMTLGPPQLHLLGLMHGYWDVDPREAAATKKGDAVNTGIAAVVPVSKIIETIHHPTMEALVTQAEKHLRASRSPKEAAAGDGPSEFDAFADLAGKLVQVPKSEIDAERTKGEG
jgi:hypothetical protein